MNNYSFGGTGGNGSDYATTTSQQYHHVMHATGFGGGGGGGGGGIMMSGASDTDLLGSISETQFNASLDALVDNMMGGSGDSSSASGGSLGSGHAGRRSRGGGGGGGGGGFATNANGNSSSNNNNGQASPSNMMTASSSTNSLFNYMPVSGPGVAPAAATPHGMMVGSSTSDKNNNNALYWNSNNSSARPGAAAGSGLLMPSLLGLSHRDEATAQLHPMAHAHDTAAPGGTNKKRPLPMPSSSYSVMTTESNANDCVSEDDEDRERRRQGRNMREQQRSHKISSCIHRLHTTLQDVGLECKADKYSILVAVVDHIRELQERATVLDAEHQMLVKTLEQTSELLHNTSAAVKSVQVCTAALPRSSTLNHGSLAAVVSASESGSEAPPKAGHTNTSDHAAGDPTAFTGVDYKCIFNSCPLAFAITSIDGRFLDCNVTFENLSGFTRTELLPLEACVGTADDESNIKNLSLFHVMEKEGMRAAFGAMSDMLKYTGGGSSSSSTTTTASVGPSRVMFQSGMKAHDTWSGPGTLCRHGKQKVLMHLSLTRSPTGRPRFFNFTIKTL